MAAPRRNGRRCTEGMRNFFVVIALRLPYHGCAYYYMAYDENSIKTLDWREHIRMRPGMYIGKLGDGTSPDDGVYVLLKEVIDNSIDEFVMGFGKKSPLTSPRTACARCATSAAAFRLENCWTAPPRSTQGPNTTATPSKNPSASMEWASRQSMPSPTF